MKKNQGFTLIETLIYLALFALIIGGGMMAVYQIIQSTDAINNKVIIEEEANFLLRKMDWALTGLDNAASITTPSASTPNSDSTLVVTKTINGTPTQLTFTFSGNTISLQVGAGGTTVPLNTSNIAVSLTPSTHLFQRVIVAGKLDAINTSFTLTTMQNGRSTTQNFSTTKYLRR